LIAYLRIEHLAKAAIRGAFVLVPLGRRKVIGLVWGASFEKFDPEKIKTIEDVLDYQPIQPELQNFIQKVADYTISPLFAVLRLVTRVRDLAAKGSREKSYL
jgi:primosomal protein N' (replication factor Y)